MEHPSAFAAELMNEPMSIYRGAMYDTWKATAEAINAIIPDMSASLTDVGNGLYFSDWPFEHDAAGLISPSTIKWIKESQNLFYAWHFYGNQEDTNNAITNALALGNAWNVPIFLTEFMSCDIWKLAVA